MSVRVSNVARPSSALASAGAPQYARSMPIARKSVRAGGHRRGHVDLVRGQVRR